MKIKDILYETPEMSTEKLLEIMNNRKNFLNLKQWSKNKYLNMQEVLDEWNLIQLKQSNLTKSQRDDICGFVSICLVEMTHGRKSKNNN